MSQLQILHFLCVKMELNEYLSPRNGHCSGRPNDFWTLVNAIIDVAAANNFYASLFAAICMPFTELQRIFNFNLGWNVMLSIATLCFGTSKILHIPFQM